MMLYLIEEVDGISHAEVLHYLNGQEPSFPKLSPHHLRNGYWWLARSDNREIVGFAGLVEMAPFRFVGYLKRAYVKPEHRGHGLQSRFLREREAKAFDLGWSQLVSECSPDNEASLRNFTKAGYEQVNPEQAWGKPGSVYLSKLI